MLSTPRIQITIGSINTANCKTDGFKWNSRIALCTLLFHVVPLHPQNTWNFCCSPKNIAASAVHQQPSVHHHLDLSVMHASGTSLMTLWTGIDAVAFPLLVALSVSCLLFLVSCLCVCGVCCLLLVVCCLLSLSVFVLCLFDCLLVCLPACLFVCLFVYLFACGHCWWCCCCGWCCCFCCCRCCCCCCCCCRCGSVAVAVAVVVVVVVVAAIVRGSSGWLRLLYSLLRMFILIAARTGSQLFFSACMLWICCGSAFHAKRSFRGSEDKWSYVYKGPHRTYSP